ncbi:MAG TPA: CoA pyrophosphatase [Gemmatimonadales bacterium]|nr:CoA pyrophosphatase [Gemmatimonadales bacterium]
MPLRGWSQRPASRRTALSRIPALQALLATRIPRSHPELERPRAAVAVVLAPDPDRVLLIQRAEREGDRWSGQLAFPGGRWSPGDRDLAETARRETREEVGLELEAVPLLGVLDDLAPRTPVLPPIVVRPFVFAVPSSSELILNHEVAGAWWIPFEEFRRPGTYAPVEYQRYGTLVRGEGYHLSMGVLWGMTERILTPLLTDLFS